MVRDVRLPPPLSTDGGYYCEKLEVPRQYFSYHDDDNDADAVRMTIMMVMMTIMMLMTTITIGDDDNYSGDDDGEVMVGR